jgi:tetratricopeptide (TPR) repeat protein
MNLQTKKIFSLVGGVLLTACSSTPPDTRPQAIQTAENLEERVSQRQVQLVPRQVEDELTRALNLYAVSDNQEGQARCHLKLARLHYRMGNQDDLQFHLVEAERIANRLDHDRFRYESALLRARLSGKAEDYERAGEYASSSIEEAVVRVYLGDPEGAYRLVSGGDVESAPDDYSFVYHHYAEAAKDAGVARKALEIHREYGNHHGVASTLFLLGRISRDAGNPQQARGYFERAFAAARALDDEALMSEIKKTLAGL